MSLVALMMNLLLACLLVAALGLGWRLERRLKALREGQAGFARAVADLDAAAMRARAGLDALRDAADEAVDDLSARIARAKAASERLEAALDRTPAAQEAAAADTVVALRRPVLRPGPVQDGAAPESLAARILRLEAEAATLELDRPLSPLTPRAAAPSPKAAVDDDLFEGLEDASASQIGRRSRR